MDNVSMLESVYILLMGMIFVFIVLFLLMGMIAVIRNLTRKVSGLSSEATAESAPAASAPVASKPLLASGSCGSVQLFDVPDQTAALVMALVAEQLKAPLNELRFISIKETDKD